MLPTKIVYHGSGCNHFLIIIFLAFLCGALHCLSEMVTLTLTLSFTNFPNSRKADTYESGLQMKAVENIWASVEFGVRL